MKKIIAFLGFLVPSVSMAAITTTAPTVGQESISDVNDVVALVLQIFDLLVYILVAFAVVYVIWNTIVYFIRSDDSEGRSAAAAKIGYGILGIFIVVSIWGLVALLTNTFKFSGTNTEVPTFTNTH